MPPPVSNPSVPVATQVIAEAMQAWSPRRRRWHALGQPRGWRRGVKRGIGRLPMLYAMRCTACGMIKIGVSGDYRQRRIELEQRTGHRLETLGIEIGGMFGEAALHLQFIPYRLKGEWYWAAPPLLTYIHERMNLPYEKREAYTGP